MIQSITFTSDKNPWSDWKNTWDDWKIVAIERPVFAPPQPKTTYIDIPGGNGSLDLSEALPGYPVYENRTGSFTFRVLNDYKDWHERYSEIMDYLHGKLMRAVLYDDREYYYRGRFTVDEWASDDTWSQITIGYNVEPFKLTLYSSAEPWRWDTFNFDTDAANDVTDSDLVDISISAESTSVTFDVPEGAAPVSPNIVVAGLASDAQLSMEYSNNALDIVGTATLKNGNNFIYDYILYGRTSYTVVFKYTAGANTSSVTVTVAFSVGRL